MAEAVEVYHRTYTTLLRSTGEMRLRVLEASHRAMGSSLHSLAGSPAIDLGAFLYAVRRLPLAISQARLVVMAQSAEVFSRGGFDLDDWADAAAPGRRRRWYDDGHGTLAVLIASASDVDDLIPTLVAFQIEWNKMGVSLRAASTGTGIPAGTAELVRACGGSEDDWAQLEEFWGADFPERLKEIAAHPKSLPCGSSAAPRWATQG